MIEYQSLNRPNWSVDDIRHSAQPATIAAFAPTHSARSSRALRHAATVKMHQSKKHQENVKKNGAAGGTGMIPEVCKMLISLKNKN